VREERALLNGDRHVGPSDGSTITAKLAIPLPAPMPVRQRPRRRAKAFEIGIPWSESLSDAIAPRFVSVSKDLSYSSDAHGSSDRSNDNCCCFRASDYHGRLWDNAGGRQSPSAGARLGRKGKGGVPASDRSVCAVSCLYDDHSKARGIDGTIAREYVLRSFEAATDALVTEATTPNRSETVADVAP
jgi:hypothetical protein